MRSKLNNVVFFACNQGGHFSQMMALNGLFGRYESVLVTDNVRATKQMAALRQIGGIEIVEGESAQRNNMKDQDTGSRLSFWSSYIKLFFSCRKIWKKIKEAFKFGQKYINNIYEMEKSNTTSEMTGGLIII